MIRDRWPTLLARASAIAVLAGVLWIVTGVAGLLVTGGVAVAWLVLPTLYVFASGVIVYAVLLGASTSSPVLGVAAFGVLFAAETTRYWPRRAARIALGGYVTLFGLVLGVLYIESQSVTILALFGGFALCSYVLHRYARVSLGLVEAYTK